MTCKPNLHILHDSGPPEGSTDYTTLVLLHGYAWQSGIFSKLLPLASKHNARLVLVNRRDYPGATPYTDDERAVLRDAEKDPAAAHAELTKYMEDLLGGWSFAAAWMTALLSNVQSGAFPVNDVDLGAYMRRIILHDAPFHVLGYPPLSADPAGNPLFDRTLPPEEMTQRFANWISGYFQHESLIDGSAVPGEVQVERYAPQTTPPPTFTTLTAEELASTLYTAPGDAGGSDCILINVGNTSGVFGRLCKDALLLRSPAETADGTEAGETVDAWRGVEVRYVWCDHSIWENVTFARLRDSNHFVHWDEPERAIQAFLAAAEDIEQ
ncbi:hypothetical protein C8Q80DRAFT_1357285 [Daedaleopsis nitida]|nr:hypothetical protein C8Q80DRAFT_1357285 [Daedaleopsis nitida]